MNQHRLIIETIHQNQFSRIHAFFHFQIPRYKQFYPETKDFQIHETCLRILGQSTTIHLRGQCQLEFVHLLLQNYSLFSVYFLHSYTFSKIHQDRRPEHQAGSWQAFCWQKIWSAFPESFTYFRAPAEIYHTQFLADEKFNTYAMISLCQPTYKLLIKSYYKFKEIIITGNYFSEELFWMQVCLNCSILILYGPLYKQKV